MASPWFLNTLGVGSPIPTHLLSDTSKIPPSIRHTAAANTADAIIEGEFPHMKKKFMAGIRVLVFNPSDLIKTRRKEPNFIPNSERLDLEF